MWKECIATARLSISAGQVNSVCKLSMFLYRKCALAKNLLIAPNHNRLRCKIGPKKCDHGGKSVDFN